ncbi:MAG: peptidylprolyl isomerase [Planctomycetales bacterium]|nr:peptidylprolyl isomerase [Planctomycetales bacterium]
MPNYRQAVDEAVADVDFDANDYQVTLETNEGDIRLRLTPDVAPGHCKNLIGLARSGYYDGLIFHRVIRGFMIQGGCPDGTGMGGPGYRIEAEFNEKRHLPGVLSMARTQDPNSAGSQFFICLESQPSLDRQYTAFGETADDESLAVVRKIGDAPCDRSDRPRSDVTIRKATVHVTPKGA